MIYISEIAEEVLNLIKDGNDTTTKLKDILGKDRATIRSSVDRLVIKKLVIKEQRAPNAVVTYTATDEPYEAKPVGYFRTAQGRRNRRVTVRRYDEPYFDNLNEFLYK